MTIDEQATESTATALQAYWVDPEEIAAYKTVARYFPEEAHKTDKRGGVDIMYVEGETVISRLNEAFAYGWDFTIVDGGINEDADECWVRGRLTIWRRVTERTTVLADDGAGNRISQTTTYTERLVPVPREQYGSQKIKRSRSSGKPLDIGFDMKGAGTDALKKCASLHGVALYLWNKEERAMMEMLIREMKEDQRQNGNGQQQGDDQNGNGQQRRFPRANRPAGRADNGQQAPQPIRINGLEMPPGFQMPFQIVMTGRGENDCHAKECVEGLDPDTLYNIGGAEPKPGSYVIKRSKEEAGCVLCVSHTGTWVRAKQAAKTASVGQAA